MKSLQITRLKMSQVIVVLPTFGCPFIWKGEEYKEVEFKELQKVVRGGIEMIDNRFIRIHPLFMDDENGKKPGQARWNLVSKLISDKTVEIYANDEGHYKCSPNMACMRLDCPVPYFGDIALIVPTKTLKKYTTIDYLSLVRIKESTDKEYESSLGGYVYEPYNDKDEKEFTKKAQENNWDYVKSSGFVFKSKKTEKKVEKKTEKKVKKVITDDDYEDL